MGDFCGNLGFPGETEAHPARTRKWENRNLRNMHAGGNFWADKRCPEKQHSRGINNLAPGKASSAFPGSPASRRRIDGVPPGTSGAGQRRIAALPVISPRSPPGNSELGREIPHVEFRGHHTGTRTVEFREIPREFGPRAAEIAHFNNSGAIFAR